MPGELMMDGIAVADEARGRGVGTALLERIEQHAMQCGKTHIALNVINTNPAARRLYERFGFTAMYDESTSILGLFLKFDYATRMHKNIPHEE